MTDNLATIMDSEIDRFIGRCNDMRAIDAALRHTLGLNNAYSVIVRRSVAGTFKVTATLPSFRSHKRWCMIGSIVVADGAAPIRRKTTY